MVDQHTGHSAPPAAPPPQAAPPAHPAPDAKAASKTQADHDRLKKLEQQHAADEAEIAQLKTRLGLAPAAMIPAGGGGSPGNPATSSVPAPAPAPEATEDKAAAR